MINMRQVAQTARTFAARAEKQLARRVLGSGYDNAVRQGFVSDELRLSQLRTHTKLRAGQHTLVADHAEYSQPGKQTARERFTQARTKAAEVTTEAKARVGNWFQDLGDMMVGRPPQGASGPITPSPDVHRAAGHYVSVSV